MAAVKYKQYKNSYQRVQGMYAKNSPLHKLISHEQNGANKKNMIQRMPFIASVLNLHIHLTLTDDAK